MVKAARNRGRLESMASAWSSSWGGSWASSWGAMFPVQIPGLRVFNGSVLDLCMVAVADAPTGHLRIRKDDTNYAVYLVATDDENASPVRIQTPAGIKAIRLKT